MKLAIVTDSTCDWSKEEYEQRNVVMVPLKIFVDDETFLDQTELSSEDFYDKMEASSGMPKTSQPSPGDFKKIYSELADSGYEAIISIHIAPTLSGTCQSAEVASQDISIPVSVIDSKSASSGLGVLVQAACELRDQGCTFEEITESLVDRAKKSHLILAPRNTDNLEKGGRITHEQAMNISVLNIKLIFGLDEEGRLYNLDKVKGFKGVTARFIEIIKEYENEYGPLRMRIMQAKNLPEAENLLAAFKEAGVNCVMDGMDTCGATVATHTGTGVVGFAITPQNMS